MAHPAISERGDFGVDAVIGDKFFQVKVGVSGLRSVREGFMPLAYWVGKELKSKGFLVLPDASVTIERLREHWQRLVSIVRPDLRDRLSLCVGQGDHFIGIPHDPDIRTQHLLAKIVATQRSHVNSARPSRGDASFVVFKILLHHWLTDGRPVTTDWLAQTSGYSYPTVAKPIAGMGSLIERQSDRKIRLRRFPRDEFARLVAVAESVRGTVRFGDRSAQPRAPEAHVRRLENLKPPNLAIGGVLGAMHYLPGLDLVGVPRLDLSQHAPGRGLDLAFIERLDPALKRVDDPTEPASVVVHHVHHANSLFTPREGGLYWADPVECLLDLHEAHLEAQAMQFLKALERRRPSAA
jgi:hypothetical protein